MDITLSVPSLIRGLVLQLLLDLQEQVQVAPHLSWLLLFPLLNILNQVRVNQLLLDLDIKIDSDFILLQLDAKTN